MRDLPKDNPVSTEAGGSTPLADAAYQGTVVVEGERATVSFEFHPRRVAFLKTIPQARFNRDSKSWTIPAKHIERLKRSHLFSPQVVNYIARESKRTAKASAEELAALERLRRDPFAVTEEDIRHLNPVVCFRFDPKGRFIVAQINPVYSTLQQRALKLFESTAGVFQTRHDGYFIPTAALSQIVKVLRNEQVSFAVEAKLGSHLKGTAERRNSAIERSVEVTAALLSESLLAPYLDIFPSEEGNLFALCDAGPEHLRMAFEHLGSFHERRRAAERMNTKEALTAIYRLRQRGVTVYRTSNAEEELLRYGRYLAKREQPFSEEQLEFVDPELAWVVDREGRGGVLVDRKMFLERIAALPKNPLAKIPPQLLAEFPGKLFFSFPDTGLLEARESIDGLLVRSAESSSTALLPVCSVSFERLCRELESRARLRERARWYQSADSSEWIVPEALRDVSGKLFPHQRNAIQWLLETPAALLGDDMGLGKTLSVLSAFVALQSRGEVEFLLVVCPNSLSRNWVREVSQWFPEKRLVLLENNKNARISALKKLQWGALKVDGLVVNYEAMRLEYVHEQLLKLVQSKNTMLCVDESQRVKNHTSKTFDALVALAAHTERRVLLSGTPTPKELSDIWAQMFILDRGERFGAKYYDWLERVAVLGNRYSDYAVQSYKPEEVESCVSRVHEILLRRRKEQVLSLPEKTFTTRDIELSGDQRKRYEEVSEELRVSLTSTSGEVFTRNITSILEEYLRAVQMASNPRIVDDSWKGEPAKFLELDEIVEETVEGQGGKIVIWTNYLVNIRELAARYQRYGSAQFSGEVSAADRDRTIEEFQKGDALKVLVAIPAAGGVGITLTAAQTAVYVDKTWNAEHWLQSIDRIHRIGQSGTVNIISLHATKVDWLIAGNLRRKEREQRVLLGDRAKDEAIIVSPDSDLMPTRAELLAALSE